MATYATTSEVRDFCQISSDDLGWADETKYEDLLDALIPFAEQVIDDYCNVPTLFFEAAGFTVTTEEHDSDGSGRVNLRFYPILSITNLWVRYTGLTQAPVWTALTAGPLAGSNYLLYPEYINHGRIEIYNGAPAAGLRNIRCTYVAGYATVPTPIAELTKELVANTLRGILKRKLTPQEISQVIMSGGDLRLFFAEDWRLNKAHKDLLDNYRISEVKGRRG
jgi:hypothetical protein